MIIEVIEYLSQKALNISTAHLQSLTPNQQLNYLKEQMEKVYLLPPHSEIAHIQGITQVIKANEAALIHYQPQGNYPNKITLFRTRNIYQDNFGFPVKIPRDETWGWGRLSTQAVEIHEVPGDHITMMSTPYVEVLAKKLSACIQEAVNAKSDNVALKNNFVPVKVNHEEYQ